MRKADSKQNNLHIDMATKKAQKVVTPIDQRETFVSIQKNFAESSISIEDQLRTLYALQQADTKIDKIMQLRGELPLEVEALEQEVAEINAKIEKNEAEIAEFTSSIAANKNNAAECASQLAKYREHLDNITNSREYDSINKETPGTLKPPGRTFWKGAKESWRSTDESGIAGAAAGGAAAVRILFH